MPKRIPHPAHREALGKILREMRRKAGLPQAAVAERLGKPQAFVSRYENGERRLDILELQAVCRVCGITLRQFVGKLEKALKDI